MGNVAGQAPARLAMKLAFRARPSTAKEIRDKMEGAMAIRLALALMVAALLTGCSMLHCQESSQNARAGGSCGVGSKF